MEVPGRTETEQGRFGAAVPGKESLRRWGKGRGKWRGARVLPLGGLGVRNGGPRRPAVALFAGGDAPVGFGRGGRTLEFQWSEAKLVAVMAWAMRVGNGPATASSRSLSLAGDRWKKLRLA